MYRVIIRPRAQKQLRKLPDRQRVRVERGFEQIAAEPLAGKKLQGEYQDLYALRIWPYRIIYTIEKKKITVYVLAIGHRQGLYR